MNGQGQLGTAATASSAKASGDAIGKLRAQNRRLGARVATLEREVAKVSHR